MCDTEVNQILNIFNFEMNCRFCLKSVPEDLISILKHLEIPYNRNQSTNLEHIILTCIGIKVLQDDNLPKWICRECVSQLTISYTFREKCIETIKYLNEVQVKAEPLNETLHFVDLQTDDCDDDPESCSDAESNKEFQVQNTKYSNENSASRTEKQQFRYGNFHRSLEGPLQCDICGSRLKSRRTLVYHMRSLHIVNLIDKSEIPDKRPDPEPRPPVLDGDNDTLFKFKCDICGSGLRTMDSVEEHMQKIHIEGNYLKRNVSADNPYECEICRNGYPNSKSLSRHRIKVHGILKSLKPVKPNEPKSQTKSKVKRWQVCPICGVMRKDMKCHIATHDSDRLFKCEICGNDLKTSVNLKRHIRRVHNEDRQYPCELCNVAFKTQFQLKRHNRKHTQERNYACTYCEKRFIDKATLERHFVVHFRERNVECKYCGKRFQSQLGLQNHVGIHTLERKFKCGLCALAFITSSAASVHRKTHRNGQDNQFHCGDCSLTFQEVIMLKMHLRAAGHRFSVELNK